jgi:hypothetical protein
MLEHFKHLYEGGAGNFSILQFYFQNMAIIWANKADFWDGGIGALLTR